VTLLRACIVNLFGRVSKFFLNRARDKSGSFMSSGDVVLKRVSLALSIFASRMEKLGGAGSSGMAEHIPRRD
jgi:hypothetical protein